MEACSFATYLENKFHLQTVQIDNVLKQCKAVFFKKGTLIHLGVGLRESLFVESGLLRYYSVDTKGKEHTLQFAPEAWFITDRLSKCEEYKSDFFLQALEDTQAQNFNADFLLEVAQENPEIIHLNQQLLNNHIRQLQDRINQLLCYSAEERYLEFVKDYPDILLRVPQIMVASYLGITPESLSRVRKDLAQRQQY